MHSITNRLTAWFRIFLGLPTIIHQVAKFYAGLDLRGLSLWSGKPTAGPYPEAADTYEISVFTVSFSSILHK